MQISRILLVDDEPNILLVLGAILRSKGFQVDTAEDGFAALRKIRAVVPDLIVSDLRMPNMNGFELMAVVRKEFPEMPIIAISGEFVGEQVEGILADAFFQKGHYQPPELLDKVRELLQPRVSQPARSRRSSVWSAVRNESVMITCSECLKSFPLNPCDEEEAPNKVQCIFCGAELEYQLVAITKSASQG